METQHGTLFYNVAGATGPDRITLTTNQSHFAMITRNWTGVIKPERADDYLAHLQNDTFKKLSAIKGFVNAYIFQRVVTDGIEFLVVTNWETMDAIKQFAGESADIAVVPQVAQEMMVRYDPVVRHYEEVLTLVPVLSS